MEPIVSIIVPVYDVENYLDRCVSSIRRQTIENIEIILVDDGSPDNCPEMCDTMAEEDARIIVVHKLNGGLASARNAGMKVAKGKYILFVDSDDWIDPNTTAELVNYAEQYKVDFVRFRPMYAGWPNHKDGDLCDFGTENGMLEGLYNRDYIVEKIFPRMFATPELSLGVIVAAWRSLYNRKFLEENNLYFDETVRYSEDTIFSAKLVYKAESFYYLDGARYYHYFFNPASITKSFKKDRWDSCKELIRCFQQAFGDCTEYDFKNQLYLQQLYCVVNVFNQRKLISDITERKKYCKEICHDSIAQNACRFIKLAHVPIKLRILLLLIKWKQAWLIARI